MLFSQSFIVTSREDPKIAESRSHKLLLKGCYLYMVSSGIYAYLPLGMRVLQNIMRIVRTHMNRAGAQELFMSALQPLELWQKTGRDETLKEVMFAFNDRKGHSLVLGPTHEEEITEIAKRYIASHKQLPCILYQIQTKFRDEPRPRFGLMRSSEFIMKDAYSFDRNEQGLDTNYEKMLAAYQAIFRDCGLDYVMMEADSGAMGGSVSHEFMLPAEIGEDVVCYCPACSTYYKEVTVCPSCTSQLAEKKMIEIGHIFKLGTKYSLAQEAFFLDENGKRQPLIMGCYGIGVSRLLAAIAELSSDDTGIAWPKGVAPYEASLLVLDESLLDDAAGIARELEGLGISVLIDDRKQAPGVKFNDASLTGSPYTLVMGKKYVQQKTIDVEVRRTKHKESFSRDGLMTFLKGEYGR